MKARKLTLSKMAARFLWVQLLNHTYDTAELRKMNPAFDELDRLQSFDRRVSDALREAGDDKAARLRVSSEIDEWEETWSEFALLLSPESYDLAKERWEQIESHGRCKKCGEVVEIGSGKFTPARFVPQQRKIVLEIGRAFDRAEEVDVTETDEKKTEPCQA